jgi:hypothetical protein
MLKRFFSAEIVRTAQSSEMFFTRKSISLMLGMTDKAVERRLSRLKYKYATGLKYDGAYEGRKHFFKYGLDAVLALIFTVPADDSRRADRYTAIIDFITAHMGNLCLDGFSSLKGYYLDLQCRRAIIAHVCGVDSYTDIVHARFNARAPYKGTMLRDRHCTPALLIQPEVYITRAEVTEIKAVDLAVHLLCKHCVDTSPAELLLSLGIDTARGADYTEYERLITLAHVKNPVL